MTENTENFEETGEATGIGQEIAAAAEANGHTEGKKQRAPASNFLPIVSGRLPLLFVHAIRFQSEGKGTKELATAYSTSVGKVFDIKKNKNFSYVTADWKPTATHITMANDWIAAIETPNKHGVKPEGNAELLKEVVAKYEAAGLATEAEVAAQEGLKPVRAPRKPKAEGEVAQPAQGDVVENSDSADVADLLLS